MSRDYETDVRTQDYPYRRHVPADGTVAKGTRRSAPRTGKKVLVILMICFLVLLAAAIAVLTYRSHRAKVYDSYITEGLWYAETKDYDSAIDAIREAIDTEDWHPESYLILASICMDDDRIEQAVQVLDLGYEVTGDETVSEMAEDYRYQMQTVRTEVRLAYDKILEEYATLIAQPDEEYLALAEAEEGYIDPENADVSTAWMAIYHRYPMDMGYYYKYYDIDGNGTKELIIRLINNDLTGVEGASFLGVVDVFAYDGLKAVPLWDRDLVGEDLTITICEDGTILMQESDSASVYYYLYHIGEDGCSATVDVYYELTTAPDADRLCYHGDEPISAEEFDEATSSYTEAVDHTAWLPIA